MIDDGPLLRLSRQLEKYTDEYVVALDNEALAENAYLGTHARAFHMGRVSGLPATLIDKNAQVEAYMERQQWNITIARTKACRAKINELEHRLSAGQSHLKYLGMADGNGR